MPLDANQGACMMVALTLVGKELVVDGHVYGRVKGAEWAPHGVVVHCVYGTWNVATPEYGMAVHDPKMATF